MLTQRLVESFLTLAETLSYTEAARRLYLSHQALSSQIGQGWKRNWATFCSPVPPGLLP